MFPNLLIDRLRYSGVLLLLMLLFKAGPPRSVQAVEADQRPLQQTALRDLLEKGWNVSLQGYQQARQQAQQLQLVTRTDHRLDYAKLLIEFKQRKYAEAERSLEALLTQYPNYLPLWRARIWFSVLTRKYEGALAEVQQLGQLVARGTLQTDAPLGAGLVPAQADEVIQLLGWTGQLVGFVEGPANTTINPVALKQQRTLLTQPWNEGQRKAFEQGRQAVLKLYAGRQLATEQLAKDSQIEVQKRLQELGRKSSKFSETLNNAEKILRKKKTICAMNCEINNSCGLRKTGP